MKKYLFEKCWVNVKAFLNDLSFLAVLNKFNKKALPFASLIIFDKFFQLEKIL